MKRQFASVCLISLLAACGGGSNQSNENNDNSPPNRIAPTPTPTPPIGNKVDTTPNNTELLSFWKSELENLNQLHDSATPERAYTSPPAPVADAPESDNSDDFSTTNIQVLGVDEVDALKFDGDVLLNLNTTANYYYFSSDSTATKPMVKVLSEAMLEGNAEEDTNLHLNAADNYSYRGLLTHANTAVLLGEAYSGHWFGDGFIDMPTIAAWECFNCYITPNSSISLDIWQYKDTQQPIAPAPVKISVEGSLVDARSIDNKMYLLSRYSPTLEGFHYYPYQQSQVDENQAIIDNLSIEDLTPNITIDGNTEPLAVEQSCILPGDISSLNYLPSLYLLTEIDMENPGEHSTICVIDHIQETYFGKNNIYLLSNNYDPQNYNASSIQVRKIKITDSGFESAGAGQVSGSLSGDGYQLGEVDGKFAIVNTVYDYTNSRFFEESFYHQLSILEESEDGLEVISQIPNDTRPEAIGKPGEMIYAVRFMNQRAYVVTFDRIDPLYVIDLSDTSDPKIAGELEIPGFSDYIHVVGDNLLFGIGKNASTVEGFTLFEGLNIRLFDVSDPSQPTALVNLDYGLRGSESALLFDPHALAYTLNESTGIARLAFPVQIHDKQGESELEPFGTYPWVESALLQVEIDTQQKTMQEVGRYIYASPETTQEDWYWSWGERSVINNNSLYFSHNSQIKVLEWGGSEVLRQFDSQ